MRVRIEQAKRVNQSPQNLVANMLEVAGADRLLTIDGTPQGFLIFLSDHLMGALTRITSVVWYGYSDYVKSVHHGGHCSYQFFENSNCYYR